MVIMDQKICKGGETCEATIFYTGWSLNPRKTF